MRLPGRVNTGCLLVGADRARKGKGPTFLEMETYRFSGHSRSDPGHYRPKEEVQFWRERDPVQRYEEFCLAERVLSAQQVEEIKASVEKELDDAIAFGEASPSPQAEDVLNDVYA